MRENSYSPVRRARVGGSAALAGIFLLPASALGLESGPTGSNAALAVGPTLFAAKMPYLSSNPGPSAYAGDKCSPWFFAQYQNDTYDEAAGKVANEKGYKNGVLIASNYPAGKDHLNGFKHLYKGAVKDEIYTRLGQIDCAPEIAQIRAAKPDAVFFFLLGTSSSSSSAAASPSMPHVPTTSPASASRSCPKAASAFRT